MPGQGAGPISPLVWLVVIEPPHPHVVEVARSTFSRGEECLQLPHIDVGSSRWEEARREAPVGADALEMRPEGIYKVVQGCSVVDLYALRSSSRPGGSHKCGGLGVGKRMIFLSRAARLPGEKVSPDALLSGSVCMSSAAGPSREGVGLGRAVGDGEVPDVAESWLFVIAASVVGVALPGSLRWRSFEPADGACIAARMQNSARAAPRLPSGTCAAMVGGAVVTLTAVAPVLQPCVAPASYAGVCGGPCGHSGQRCGAVVGLLSREGFPDGAEICVTVFGAAGGPSGLGVLSLVLAWEGAAEELEIAASAVLVCTFSAARRARSVGGRMLGICVRSVQGLLFRRFVFGRGWHLPAMFVLVVVGVSTEGQPPRC